MLRLFEATKNLVPTGVLCILLGRVNIQNLGSKESVGDNYKDGICAESCLKLWYEKESVGVKYKDGICAEWCLKPWYMKATGIFVILVSQDGFESDCPETKFQTATSSSEAAIRRCSSSQQENS